LIEKTDYAFIHAIVESIKEDCSTSVAVTPILIGHCKLILVIGQIGFSRILKRLVNEKLDLSIELLKM